MKITLKDIASELGMNESTVSYALANKGSIKAETRERILRTAAKMGYVPNRSAQQVSTGKSNLIGLVVPNVLFELGEYCEHIFRLLSDAGYLTSIMVTEFSPERERSIFRNLIGQGAAGIIVCPTTHRANPSSSEESPLHLARLNGVPVICRNIDPQENCVMPDYHAIGSLLGGKLRKCGHRDIALMIPHSAPFPAFFDDLRNGVLETLGKRADVRMEAVSGTPALCPDGPFPTNPHYELQMRSMLAAGYIEVTEELFRQVWHSPRKRPDAMICFSENTAVGLIAAARERHIHGHDTAHAVRQFSAGSSHGGICSAAGIRGKNRGAAAEKNPSEHKPDGTGAPETGILSGRNPAPQTKGNNMTTQSLPIAELSWFDAGGNVHSASLENGRLWKNSGLRWSSEALEIEFNLEIAETELLRTARLPRESIREYGTCRLRSITLLPSRLAASEGENAAFLLPCDLGVLCKTAGKAPAEYTLPGFCAKQWPPYVMSTLTTVLLKGKSAQSMIVDGAEFHAELRFRTNWGENGEYSISTGFRLRETPSDPLPEESPSLRIRTFPEGLAALLADCRKDLMLRKQFISLAEPGSRASRSAGANGNGNGSGNGGRNGNGGHGGGVGGSHNGHYYRRRKNGRNKWSTKKKVIVGVIVGLLVLIAAAVIGVYAYIQYNLGQMNDHEFRTSEVENPNISLETKEKMEEGYWTIAIFGLDSRDSSTGKGNRADVIMIVNLDRKTGKPEPGSEYYQLRGLQLGGGGHGHQHPRRCGYRHQQGGILLY